MVNDTKFRIHKFGTQSIINQISRLVSSASELLLLYVNVEANETQTVSPLRLHAPAAPYSMRAAYVRPNIHLVSNKTGTAFLVPTAAFSRRLNPLILMSKLIKKFIFIINKIADIHWVITNIYIYFQRCI